MSAVTYVWRHPKTGIYYFRRGVPARLRLAIGKTMTLASLGTKDVAEAKRLAVKKAAEVDRQFRDAVASAVPKAELSQATIERLAEIHLANMLEEDEEGRLVASSPQIQLCNDAHLSRPACPHRFVGGWS